MSHKLATAYLIRKVNYGNLRLQFFGLEIDDLALDCIADLFQRCEDGRFSVFEKYFQNHSKNADAQVALRRLVFSKVNENLFRRYHETDANLSRIIRNIKDSIKADERLHMVRYKGQQWVAIADPKVGLSSEGGKTEADIQARFHLDKPAVPPEILEGIFVSHLSTTSRVRDLLTRFITFVNRNPEYARGMRLIAFAQIIRSAYRRLDVPEEDGVDESERLLQHEVERAVELVTERLMADKRASYVGRGKVDESTYENYFSAIRMILYDQYLYDAETDSYYAALCDSIPGLTESDYMQQHRNILEYLAKLARTRLIRYLTDKVS